MDTVAGRKLAEEQKQEEIRRQIALLQAQLTENKDVASLPTSPKRKQAPGLLAPATPSPKRRRIGDFSARGASSSTGTTRTKQPTSIAKPPPKPQQNVPSYPAPILSAPPAPSNLLKKLAKVHIGKKSKESAEDAVARSQAFSDRPAPTIRSAYDEDNPHAAARDDTLALIEDIPLGPAEFNAPADDPNFEKLEPNSSIRLTSRSIPHEQFQDYLRGRYYLSPSKLYSVVRLLPNKSGYDVPVCGDWLTIAVVAERGKMKYTQAPVGVGQDDDKPEQEADMARMDELPPLDAPAPGPSSFRPYPQKKAAQAKAADRKPGGKKYFNLKLVDFGCRARTSASGGPAKIRGDALLSLLLFEADAADKVLEPDGTRRTVYRGGSRGAFERMSRLREGAVVALLNPRILKPFQRENTKPHPTDNILAITPESDGSILVLGHAQDLGSCKAMKRDGMRCTGWCDKRVSEVCDFHVQAAVERNRATRPEFSSGTGGMRTNAKKKQADYDPSKHWGLKPVGGGAAASSDGGTTYVMSGHVISAGGAPDPRSLYLGESIGRDAQARAARKLEKADADRALQALLKRDRAGTKTLASAREFVKKKAAEEGTKGKGKSKEKSKDKDKERAGKRKAPEPSDGSDDGEGSGKKEVRRSAYSADMIKQLGFDPAAKDGHRAPNPEVKSKLDALAALQASRKDVELGRRPGKKSTCVWRPETTSTSDANAPSASADADADERADSPMRFPDSDDDELEKAEEAVFGHRLKSAEKLVNLDDSDDELQVLGPDEPAS